MLPESDFEASTELLFRAVSAFTLSVQGFLVFLWFAIKFKCADIHDAHILATQRKQKWCFQNLQISRLATSECAISPNFSNECGAITNRISAAIVADGTQEAVGAGERLRSLSLCA